MAGKTIFKRIIDKEIPSDIVYEDDECLAFRDVNPQAPVHFLVIPKKEIASLADADDDDAPLLGRLLTTARMLAAQMQLERGYRIVVNCGLPGTNRDSWRQHEISHQLKQACDRTIETERHQMKQGFLKSPESRLTGRQQGPLRLWRC